MRIMSLPRSKPLPREEDRVFGRCERCLEDHQPIVKDGAAQHEGRAQHRLVASAKRAHRAANTAKVREEVQAQVASSQFMIADLMTLMVDDDVLENSM